MCFGLVCYVIILMIHVCCFSLPGMHNIAIDVSNDNAMGEDVAESDYVADKQHD